MAVPAWITENAVLAPLTTFRVGGAARWFAEPSTAEEVAETLEFAGTRSLPVKVLGGGSNLLVADSGVDAVVVRLSERGRFGAIDVDGDEPSRWRVGAAVPLQSLVAEAVREGRAGLESMAGIPGRVGGAVAMNAGGASEGVGRLVAAASVFGLDGARRRLVGSELGFAYRSSAIKGLLATSFEFELPDRDDPDALQALVREYRERKKASQPLSVPSAGCVFKNPPSDSAGALLDLAGCKGMVEGKARVSEVHANFIVVEEGANAAEIARLAARMRRAVRIYAGVGLEPEIELWGNEPEFSALGAA